MSRVIQLVHVTEFDTTAQHARLNHITVEEGIMDLKYAGAQSPALLPRPERA